MRERERQRISMRINLEVLNSSDLTISTRDSEYAGCEREYQRMSKRNLCLEFLWLDHNNKYK